jgi:hypothetical protein
MALYTARKDTMKAREVSDDELDSVSGGGILGDFNTVLQAIGTAVHAAEGAMAGALSGIALGGSGAGSASGSSGVAPKSTWL